MTDKPLGDSTTRENGENVQVEDANDNASITDEDKNTIAQHNEDTYGPCPWIVVTRKKNGARIGKKR